MTELPPPLAAVADAWARACEYDLTVMFTAGGVAPPGESGTGRGWAPVLARRLLAPWRPATLFAAACCRDVWPLVEAADLGRVVEAVERRGGDALGKDDPAWADAIRTSLNGLAFAAGDVGLSRHYARAAVQWAVYAADTGRDAWQNAARAAGAAAYAAGGAPRHERQRSAANHVGEAAAQARQGKLLAGIVGPGTRFDPAWRTGAAVGLAKSIYAAADWSALPVLADALEDAGCDDAAVIDFLRGPGPFCRGVWVIEELVGARAMDLAQDHTWPGGVLAGLATLTPPHPTPPERPHDDPKT